MVCKSYDSIVSLQSSSSNNRKANSQASFHSSTSRPQGSTASQAQGGQSSSRHTMGTRQPAGTVNSTPSHCVNHEVVNKCIRE